MTRAKATALVALMAAGDRAALAQMITHVESAIDADRIEAIAAINAAPMPVRALRVGITGAPGAGKSTLINALVHQLLMSTSSRIAVLTIDPSSIRSHGSLLGDKTRMVGLSDNERVFVRSTPSSGVLGGVHTSTAHAVTCCEIAGFDVVIVETVGVGQSEVAVADLVDRVALLVTPGAGDDLQGAKRGIVEIADVIVVTKSDGKLSTDADRVATSYRDAMHLLGRDVAVLTCSSTENIGIAEVAAAVWLDRSPR
jgi:LAO/AO transport system kinase